MPNEKQPPGLSVDAFAKIVEKAVRSDFFSPDRVALMEQLSAKLVRDPALLQQMERLMADHAAELRRVAPAESALVSSGWLKPGGTTQMAPAAAAAALAPAAAALAAGPCSDGGGGGGGGNDGGVDGGG
jgi:uncharacterized protein with von Willebrand factor type A (vWA) domain